MALIITAPASSTPTLAAPPPFPLEELRRRWIAAANVSDSSIEIYASATKKFLLWLANNKIPKPTKEDILDYKKYLEETKKPTTVRLYLAATRQFFKWLDAENVYKDVTVHVKSPNVDPSKHKREYLTSNQVKTVLKNITRQTETEIRDYAILLLMVTCGLRRSEVCQVDAGDLQTVENGTRLYIRNRVKTDKTDFVNIPPPIVAAIREYLAVRDKRLRYTPTPLFTSSSRNSNGQRLSPRFISEIVKTWLVRAGYNSDGLCAHSLRLTAVTLALFGGKPLQEVQQFARHTSIVTTMIYAHNIDKERNTCAQTVAGAIF